MEKKQLFGFAFLTREEGSLHTMLARCYHEKEEKKSSRRENSFRFFLVDQKKNQLKMQVFRK